MHKRHATTTDKQIIYKRMWREARTLGMGVDEFKRRYPERAELCGKEEPAPVPPIVIEKDFGPDPYPVSCVFCVQDIPHARHITAIEAQTLNIQFVRWHEHCN